MTQAKDPVIRCPTCRKVLSYRDIGEIPHFPFCSERCRMVDLGHWLGGHYRVEGESPAGEGPEEAEKNP
ncbi:MAG TPA: DNA gyrase inhibitor YacG [Planctomycetota bacterium]|nr:DNA gyrase inhibitor YacG [Planctomycetota bacterium]